MAQLVAGRPSEALLVLKVIAWPQKGWELSYAHFPESPQMQESRQLGRLAICGDLQFGKEGIRKNSNVKIEALYPEGQVAIEK